MNCERCGKEMSDEASICPACGTGIRPVQPPSPPSPISQPVTGYGNYLYPGFGEPQPDRPIQSAQQAGQPGQQGLFGQAGYSRPSGASHEQGYAPHLSTPPQQGYVPAGQQAEQYNYNQAYGPSQAYAPGYANVAPANNQMFAGSTYYTTGKNDSALVVEIILSLFGIFGVGWLMAGETTVGVMLLVASFFVYWPIMILGTTFTFGIGLVCLGPLAIAAIITNALLLNTTLNRKARRFVYPFPPPQQPPRSW